jgi:mRNA interferase MazF
VAGKRPRQGWVYMINPLRISLQCANGHQHIYNLDALEEVDCQTRSCNYKINSSRVFRGTHPHIIWTSDEFQDESNFIQTYTTIPLTSKNTFSGLPTTYPITNTTKNGLDKKSYALVHQVSTVDGHCFKDASGNWLDRMGQLDPTDKEEIERRLKYFFGFDNSPDEDWFKQNASLKLVQKIFSYLPNSEKDKSLETLLEDLE